MGLEPTRISPYAPQTYASASSAILTSKNNFTITIEKSQVKNIKYYKENIDSDAHWIYYPDLTLDYHRILIRHNFCPRSRGYWTETNAERFDISNWDDSTFYNEYAYPLNTIDKPRIMAEIIGYSTKRNVFPLGRWGEHQHYNSDLTVYKAMKLFDEICG